MFSDTLFAALGEVRTATALVCLIVVVSVVVIATASDDYGLHEPFTRARLSEDIVHARSAYSSFYSAELRTLRRLIAARSRRNKLANLAALIWA